MRALAAVLAEGLRDQGMAGVVLEDAAERSAKRHRSFVRTRMGVTYDAARVREVADEAIRKAAQAKDNPADLINVALEELVRAECELPGYTTLDEMTKKIRTEVNRGFFKLVSGRVDAGARARLARLLLVDPITRRSEYDGLKDVAQAASLNKFKGSLAFLRELDALGPTEEWLEGIPPGKVAHFAGEARVTDVADLQKVLDEDKRLTLIVSLLHTVRTGVRDDVVTMFCKRLATIHKKGRDQLEALREAHRAEFERLLGVFGDVLDGVREAVTPSDGDADGPGTDPAASAASGSGDVAERAGRLVLKALEDAGGLDALAAAHEAVSAYHGNNYLPLLDQHYRSHRSALFTLVESIDLESTNAERSVLDAVEYLQAQRNARATVVPDRISVQRAGPHGTAVAVELVVDVDAFASAMWRKILKDPGRPGLLVRRHLEVCVFSYLASELKSGDIAVAGSDSYANLHDQLMSWEECEPLVEGFCAEAGLPTDPRELTRHYRQLLADTAAGVDAGYPANTDLTLEGGRPVLKRRKGAERSKEALKLEEAVHERLPQRDLLDILTRTAYQTGWTRHLGPASGSDPKIKEALGRYVLMVFTYGTLLGPAQVAAHMRGKVSAAEIAMTANKHSTSDKIFKASTDVINEFNKLDIASVWGDGKTVAADGSQIETWENNLLAALMGFDLLPRIRNWHDLIFYRPTPGIRYQHIDSLFGDEAIDWTLIETHWTDLLRTAISIRENRLSSVTLLRRLGNHSRKNRLYRAFRELGRAVRTITLLRYLSDPDLREQITQVTNRNESFHNFADWLMFGGKLIGHNDPDYQEKIIKFNELLANCVIYSTAQDITDAANAIAADGHPVDLDDLATISPYITHVIRRFGNWILNLTPPATAPTTNLELESRVLFAP